MTGGETKATGLHVPGFQHLGWLLPQHVDLVSELYFLFIALMMGQPIKLLPADSKVIIVARNSVCSNLITQKLIFVVNIIFSSTWTMFGISCLVFLQVILYLRLLLG